MATSAVKGEHAPTTSNRPFLFVVALALSLVGAAVCSAKDETAWRPTSGEIAKMEARLRLPAQAHDLLNYARYYSGVIVSGRHIIDGYLYLVDTPEIKPRAYINQPHDVIPHRFAGDGCAVVTLRYDVEKSAVIGLRCSRYP